MLQIYLVINVTGAVEPTEQGSVWKKCLLHLNSTYLLELLAADYLCETNIILYYILVEVFGSLGVLKNPLRRKTKNKE